MNPDRIALLLAAVRLAGAIMADDRKAIATEVRNLIDLGADQIPPQPALLSDDAAKRDVEIADLAEAAKLGPGG